jgi:hypothetical protein
VSVHDPLKSQVSLLAEVAADRAAAWSALATRRRRLHFGLGVPAVVLAAVAGATTLAERSPLVSGVCALLSAILAGLQTFLRPDAGAVRAREQAIGWSEVADDAHLLVAIDYPTLDGGQRRQRYDELRERARGLRRSTAKSPNGTEAAVDQGLRLRS